MHLKKITRKYVTTFIGLVTCGFFLIMAYSSFHFSAKIHRSSFKTRLKSQTTHMLRPTDDDTGDDIDNRFHLMFIFFQTHDDRRLRRSLQRCLSSLLETTAEPHLDLVLHVFGDTESFSSFQEILEEINIKKKPKVVYHDLNKFPETIERMRHINNGIGKVEHDFSHPYFYLSLFLHKLLPHNIPKLMILDIDIVIKSDISELHALFNDFSDTNMIGIARENQPTYRYMFYEFRSANPGTKVGEPPPMGLTGFNSGVVLLDLTKMRNSLDYNDFLKNGTLAHLATKYHFQGNLGDQDAFTLISLEQENLFYVLPCGWNRQLCKWWQTADFEGVFGSYFSCDEKIHILHGNCHTQMDA